VYKKKIIVTGANGFLGKNVVNLLKKNYLVKKLSFKKFTQIKKDKKKKFLDNFIKTHKPFAVIHLATYFSKKKDKKTLIKCLNVNYLLSKMLYQVTIDNFVNKFIYTGSNYENIKDKNKIYPYLLSKKKYSLFLENSNTKKTKLICIYLSNVYGENDKRKKILNHLFKAAKIKRNMNFKTFKSSSINFIYVKDVVEIIRICILKKFLKKKLFFNIRFKKNFSLSQIILNFTKINKYISCEEVKTVSKNLEVDESDIIYKYKKFISYIPKINVNKWIQKKLSNQKD
jgi:nucleoside-diphosphate-sugar epimerase